jgi:hypothetical protein
MHRSGRARSHATSGVPVTMPLMFTQARTSRNSVAASGRSSAARTSAPPLLSDTSTTGSPARRARKLASAAALAAIGARLGTGTVSAGHPRSAASASTR